MSKAALGFLVGIAILSIAGAWWYLSERNTMRTTNDARQSEEAAPSDDTPIQTQQAPGASIGDENLVQFQCDGGLTMTAVFTRDIVGLTLSDGRQLELRQAESGSGIRFVNANESIEFRSKGEDGYLSEGGEITYENCVARI